LKQVQKHDSLEEEEALSTVMISEDVGGGADESKQNHDQWKLYLMLVSQDKPACMCNYKFVSIKLFMALLRDHLITITADNKIDESSICYSYLDSAFELYTHKKDSSKAIAKSESATREERYAAICKKISKVLVKTGVKKQASKWVTEGLKWEAYANLQTVLPPAHPLFKVLLPQNGGAAASAKISRAQPSTGAAVEINHHSLNLKTKERLYQWWLHRPFSNEDIMSYL